MTTPEAKLERAKDTLRRIYELSERGVGGEKESAQRKLAALLKKYDLTLSELLSSHEEPVVFRWKTAWEEKLLVQVIGMVKNSHSFRSWRRGKRRELIVELTASEAIDVRRFYAHYRIAFERQLADFFHAFCQRNHLFPEASAAKERDLTPEEIARLRRIVDMAGTLIPSPAPRALLNGKGKAS
jgi:hypothetical protein